METPNPRMQIRQLPDKIYKELSSVLDRPGEKDWEALVAVLPERIYSKKQVEKLENIAQYKGSPAEELLRELGSQSVTVGELICYLAMIEHREAILLLEPTEIVVHNMLLTAEEEYFIKIAKIILDIVPKYLRKLFIHHWDNTYPNHKWQNDSLCVELLLSRIPSVNTACVRKMKKESIENWGTAVLIYAFMDCRHHFIEGLRFGRERVPPLRLSEGMLIISSIYSDFCSSATSMQCPYATFTDVTSQLKNLAIDVFGADAENEIDEIIQSPLATETTMEQLKQQLLKEKTPNAESDSLFKDLMFNMEISVEEENFIKITKIILDILPTYLRRLFAYHWSKRSGVWASRREDLSTVMLSTVTLFDSDIRNRHYREKMHSVIIAKWDISTLLFAFLESGLRFMNGCRPVYKRSLPLRICEEIDILWKIKKDFFQDPSNMQCSSIKFAEVTSKIKSVVRNIIGADAEHELDGIIRSKIATKMTIEQLKQQLPKKNPIDEPEKLFSESSMEDEEDDDESESPSIRSEVRFISGKGAAMELYVTGIKLKVPSGAFTSNTIVRLSILDPSTAPEFQTDIGEKVLGNVVKVGPARLEFNVPAILSIPYSIVDIPMHSSICIKYFDESTQKWLHCPVIPGDDDENKCSGYADKPGLYVLCLLLDIDSHIISQSLAEIWPFGMQPGVEVVFDENTFQNEQTIVDFKINTFTRRICKDFESAGMKPISILHVNVRNNCKPLKPVKVSFPIPADLPQENEVLIFQCGTGDEFEDVTKQSLFDWSQHRISLRIEHFSLLFIVIKLRQVLNTDNMRRLWCNMYEVHVCVYEMKGKEWLLRIGCCEASRREEMDHEMRIDMFDIASYFTARMHHGTKLAIDFNGFYTVDNDEKVIVFNENTIEFTKPLELHQKVPSECTGEISFLPDGTGEPIVLPLKENGASDRSVLLAMQGSKGAFQNDTECSGSVDDFHEEGTGTSSVEDALASSEEPTLSDVKDDKNIMNYLKEKLDHSNFGNIKDLCLMFRLSYKKRCLVMNCALPCRHFVTDLFQTRKDLSLLDLKNDVEEISKPPNKMIFKKIIKDVRSGSVSFSLHSKLSELAVDDTVMEYMMDNLADSLVPGSGTLLPSWKNVGTFHGYTGSNFDVFCSKAQSTNSRTERLLSLICEKEPSLPISDFITKLKHFKRNDIAIEMEKWRDMKMLSTNSSHL